MPLEPGTRFGPYEIVTPLGAGGMGEVYKARDTRLDRTVAIKVLPTHIAKREDLRARFEREARAVSSLNHPNICSLFDVGSHDGVGYMVMEHIDGEALAERIKVKGALPLELALKYAMQIADALDRAHRNGVVHRDVKPSNIMITRDGAKVLDFGLAKTASSNSSSDDVTLTAALTNDGTIMGTPQYMAPEQYEGREADQRSDIFAFGCVVYEMITGKRAFDGKTKASVVAAVLGSDPPSMSALLPVTPPALENAVRLCLAKDPEERWQSMKDVLLVLRTVGEPTKQSATPPAKRRLLWAGALLLGAFFCVLAGWLFRAPAPTQGYNLSIAPPGGTAYAAANEGEGGLAISPDGTTLAFVGVTAGRRQLWLRRLDSQEARMVPDTDGAYYPFWSPDGRTLGFFSPSALRAVDLSGGPARTICNALTGRHGTWNTGGVILFSSALMGRVIFRVAATGGTPEPITVLEKSGTEDSHYWPHFLPDGRHFLYLARSNVPANNAIWAATVDRPSDRKRVVASLSNAMYVPPAAGSAGRTGFLLYVRERGLVAQAFDASNLEVSGDPFPVGSDVGYVPHVRMADFSVSATGTLVYGAGGLRVSRLQWRERDGKASGVIAEGQVYYTPSLSPDGNRLAYSAFDETVSGWDVWTRDLSRDNSVRHTFSPAIEFYPIWKPDGSEIAWTAINGEAPGVHRKSLVSSDASERLTTPATFSHRPSSWTPDGRFLILTEMGSKGTNLAYVPMDGTRELKPLLRTEYTEAVARISPDGRWMAYHSDETNRFEVYVQPFAPGQPAGGEKHRVSIAGGFDPRWRGDGKELFYRSLDNKMMAASVETGPARFQAGSPVPLFETPTLMGAGIVNTWQYDVTSDGKRFVLVEVMGEGNPKVMTVTTNWQAGVKR